MKYRSFLNDNSERSNLFYELYEYDLINSFIVDENSTDSKKKLRDRDPLEVKKYINDWKNNSNELRVQPEYICTNDEHFFDFKLYIKRKYPDLDSFDLKILIHKSINNVSMFLWEFFRIISDTSRVIDKYNLERIDPDELEEYLQLYNLSEVQDFIYAISKHSLFTFTYDLELDYEIDMVRKASYSCLSEDSESKEHLKKVIKFIILQYEVILSEILYNLYSKDNLETQKPEYIQEMINDTVLDIDGKTVLGNLEDLINSLKCHVDKFDYNFIHRNFVKKNGKRWNPRTIQQKLTNLKDD